jgi:hypothetical protein
VRKLLYPRAGAPSDAIVPYRSWQLRGRRISPSRSKPAAQAGYHHLQERETGGNSGRQVQEYQHFGRQHGRDISREDLYKMSTYLLHYSQYYGTRKLIGLFVSPTEQNEDEEKLILIAAAAIWRLAYST